MHIERGVKLQKHTTFDIGGTAKFFAVVCDEQELTEAIRFAMGEGCPYYIIGGGSNILFSDDGYEGLIIKILIDDLEVLEQAVRVGAGHNLLAALNVMANAGLSGLEKMAGIPGTIGGAVRGNAGAFGTEIGSFVGKVKAYDTNAHQVVYFESDECFFAYRQSFFKREAHFIILEVELSLEKGDPQEIMWKMESIIHEREQKHIQDIKSGGSFFMNPDVSEDVQKKFLDDKGVESKEGRVPAGWLLERVGLDQEKIGGIQAGEMHANYFINIGEGTAEQVLQLASLAKTRVRDQFDVQLKEEVQLVGF